MSTIQSWRDGAGAGFRHLLLNPHGGRVGVGVKNPGYDLDVAQRMRVGGDGGPNSAGIAFRNNLTSADRGFVGMYRDDYLGFYGWPGAGWGLVMNVVNGNVGIGTATTSATKLHVNGDLRLGTDTSGRTISSPARLHIQSDEYLYLNPWGGSSVIVGGGGGSGHLWVTGTTTTRVLEITGGSDVAEPFAVSDLVKPEPGMVMAIDPQNPGELRLATQAYDRTVAGIISGANGINPGLTLKQTGSAADGTHPVALSGRVYCWCDATLGEIQPGDLLTTSDTPGHAMAVTNFTRAHGATIGKAMTPLKDGKGLVLVLVSLQ